ncbi:hypothetical protein [Stigmatella aurantiaca]|uniref:Uncharacterized protein n=1 Tax=Stigmatella aurantiaca (strain DW4/3-1) TaxID=378806 RepID=E3FMW0_STIAD|nr:hypothetical protein [Stigmatella aurantiaca]ADO73075.1 uncharacterized protein STAUR_5304 [Stigmatella aurantiaca DW4/3-1]
MKNRFLLAIAVAVGLVGCGNSNEEAAEQQGARTYENVRITRNADSTFSLKAGDQTLGNITSVKIDDAKPGDVNPFAVSPGQDLQAPAQDLCCNSCSLSGGVLICTGCSVC